MSILNMTLVVMSNRQRTPTEFQYLTNRILSPVNLYLGYLWFSFLKLYLILGSFKIE